MSPSIKPRWHVCHAHDINQIVYTLFSGIPTIGNAITACIERIVTFCRVTGTFELMIEQSVVYIYICIMLITSRIYTVPSCFE